MRVQEEAKPVKAAKAPKMPKRPGTAYTLFVKEKYSSVSDTLPEGDRNVGMVRLGILLEFAVGPTSAVTQRSDPIVSPSLTERTSTRVFSRRGHDEAGDVDMMGLNVVHKTLLASS